jgi:hypothetical protein
MNKPLLSFTPAKPYLVDFLSIVIIDQRSISLNGHWMTRIGPIRKRIWGASDQAWEFGKVGKGIVWESLCYFRSSYLHPHRHTTTFCSTLFALVGVEYSTIIDTFYFSHKLKNTVVEVKQS